MRKGLYLPTWHGIFFTDYSIVVYKLYKVSRDKLLTVKSSPSSAFPMYTSLSFVTVSFSWDAKFLASYCICTDFFVWSALYPNLVEQQSPDNS